jgi:hypothetical protein
MIKKIKIIIILTAFILSAASAYAAENPKSQTTAKQNNNDETASDNTEQATQSDSERAKEAEKQNKNSKNIKLSSENTFKRCSDNIDNDNDSYIDCKDQDCQIFARCVPKPETKIIVVTPEQGVLCNDGIDNDNNGAVDCYDFKCHKSKQCKNIVYKREIPKNKPQKYFISVGIGVALPNFNMKDIRIDSKYGKNIPFDPDVGAIAEFKFGMVPLTWLGFGLDFNFGATAASNREEYILSTDSHNKYKYDASKAFIGIGMFARLQYPVKRVVPRIDLAGLYTHTEYDWSIYDKTLSWDDINYGYMPNSQNPAPDFKYKDGNSFTLTVEPGVDIFIVPRFFSMGASVRLPVYSSRNPGMVNIGILAVATFTPSWREPKTLKKEYRKKIIKTEKQDNI